MFYSFFIFPLTADFTPNYVFKFHEDFATIHRVLQNGGVAILTKKYYMMHPDNKVKMLSIKEKAMDSLLSLTYINLMLIHSFLMFYNLIFYDLTLYKLIFITFIN